MRSIHTHAVLSYLTSILAVFAVLLPIVARAEAPRNMQISPAVIDEKAKQRDIIKESVTLQNTGDRPLKLFPAVEDINPQNGNQNFSYAGNADARSDSLANWIELSRGVIEIAPGETKTVPFIIHVNLNAVPGTYHAAITFTNGGTRDDTLNKNPDGVATVNVEVQADIKEGLQLEKFTAGRIVFSGDDVIFNYLLQNNGNQDLVPTGDIRIYDRRGQEVATVNVNKEGKAVTPDKIVQLASAWSAVNGFGQYKALITVNYGKSQTASVQDTVFFWIVPWKQIFGLLTATVIAIVVLGLYFHRMFEERHLNKLALAGLLKTHPMTAAAISQVPYFPPATPVLKSPPRPRVEKKEETKEPQERIVVRVAQNIVIAARLFMTFKRSGRLTPEDIVQKKEFPKMTPEPTKDITHVHDRISSSHVPAYTVSAREHGETIDLKKISSHPKENIHEGHVVNLKKPV